MDLTIYFKKGRMMSLIGGGVSIRRTNLLWNIEAGAMMRGTGLLMQSLF